jgi:hypothetical protein
MPGSATSVFSEADDFKAALHAAGCHGLLVIALGQFRARLTQISLQRLRPTATDKTLLRIALVAVPADMLLVSLPAAAQSSASPDNPETFKMSPWSHSFRSAKPETLTSRHIKEH